MPISLSGSLIITGSITAGSITGSLSGSLIGSANSASFAQTASSADNFVVRQGLTGSNALFTGAITAQTLVVQTVTSSIVYSSGSNRFGNQLTDVQQMTGSLRVTGSGDHYIVGGNVGVGTTSPASKTHISFQNDFDGLRIQNSNRGHNYLLTTAGTSAEYFSIYDLDNSQYLYQASNAGHSFLTGGSTRIAITSGGDVGIGTTNPGSKLHVSGGFIRVEGTSTDQYFLEGVRTGASTTLRIYDNNSVVYYDSYNSMAFRANQNGGNSGVIVFNGGDVGIGTTSPSYKLDVNGTGRFQDNLLVSKNDAVNDAVLSVRQLANGTAASLQLSANNDSGASYNFIQSSTTGGTAHWRIGGNGTTSTMHLYTGGTIKATLDSSGNLGLGVTPSAWGTGKAFEINFSGNGLWSYGQENIYLLSNAYYNGGFKYGGNGKAGDYEIFQGAHYWNIAPNNTSGAGAALTFTQAMTLSSDGNLRIGTTSDYLTNGASRRNISINGTSETILTLGVGDTWKSYFFTNATGTQLVASGSNTVYIGNTPGYLYINSSGNFGIGTTSPNNTLHIVGTTPQIRASYSTSTDTRYSELSWYGVTGYASNSNNNDFNIGFDGGNSGNGYGNLNFNTGASGSSQTRMRITSDGNVGIGTTNPGVRLDVTGSSAGNYIAKFRNASATGYGIKINPGGDAYEALRISNAADTLDAIKLYGDGKGYFEAGVYIGVDQTSANLIDNASNGASSATLYIGNASINTTSDLRLKTNIVNTGLSGINTLNKLRVVDFNWKDPSDTSWNNRNARGTWTGLIAQETIKHIPYVVNAPRDPETMEPIEDSQEGYWQIEYQHLVPVLIKAVQELKAENDSLKSRIEQLESKQQ